MAGEQHRRPLADEPDAEAVEKPAQLPGLAGFDLQEQVVGRFVGHALESDQLVAALAQVIEVGEVAHEALLEELVDEHVAEPLDVHRVAPREVAQPLLDLRRAGRVRAAPVDLALGLDG